METYSGMVEDEMISSLSFKIDPQITLPIENQLLIRHKGVKIILREEEQ